MRGSFLRPVLGFGAAILAAAPAFAAGPPAFVVPGRADVPVIINGVDASWCVVNGDWGLDRPGEVSPTVICPVAVLPDRAGAGRYYPSTGEKPRLGRLEVQPPAHRPLPRPAESFYRVWSAAPEKLPATEYPHFDPPAVMMQPQYPSSSSPSSPSSSSPSSSSSSWSSSSASSSSSSRKVPMPSHR